jgi:hypothetical protein
MVDYKETTTLQWLLKMCAPRSTAQSSNLVPGSAMGFVVLTGMPVGWQTWTGAMQLGWCASWALRV